MKKIAIYPGSFDPITNGHFDVIQRSSIIFDELIVAVTDNSKKESMFDISNRIKMIQKTVQNHTNVKVESFSGLLMNYAELKDAIVIIRGLRVLSDFEYEFKMAMMNRGINKNIDTLFLMPNSKYVHISSSLIKEIAALGGDIGDYVPSFILDEIYNKVNAKK